MIPKRIKLQGLLSYRDEQEIVFDDSSLWMLTGTNGSGKSSVFDGMTYALFGYHRGGSHGAVDLITKGENGFAVEFDFGLDGELYRIRRTLRRRGIGVTATQQISFWSRESGRWTGVADTHLKKEFDQWIADHIGLNYETFTSSVLLLQGRAEKLLEATAKGRAEVLASIVDLQRYQKLHEKADGERKTLRGRVEELQARWSGMPEITDLEQCAAANRVAEAAEALQRAQRDVEARQELEFQARQWSELRLRFDAAMARRNLTERVVQEFATAERDLERLRVLRAALPHLEVVLMNRGDLRQAEDAAQQHAHAIRDFENRLAERQGNLDQARLKKANLAKRVAADEQRHREIAQRLPALSAQLERIQMHDRQRAALELDEAELARCEPELPARLAAAQRRVDDWLALQAALPGLARLSQLRLELLHAREQIQVTEQREAEIRATGERLKTEMEALRPELEEAQGKARTAQDSFSSERTLLQEAAKLREEFDRLDGAKVCRVCGQALTPAHFQQEKQRRDGAWVEAGIKVKQAGAVLQAAQQHESTLKQRQRALEHDIQIAREKYVDSRKDLEQARNEATRAAKGCSTTYGEIGPAFRERVATEPPADWAATAYPTEGELAKARDFVAELPQARRDVEEVRDRLNRFRELSSRVAAARQLLADQKINIAGHPDGIRRDFVKLDSEARALVEQLHAMKRQDEAFQEEIDRLANECQQLRERLTEAAGKLETEEAKKKLCEQAIAGARKALATEWQQRADAMSLAEWNRLRAERAELEDAGIEARVEQRRQAQVEAESLRQMIAELEQSMARFPPEAQQEPLTLQALLQEARDAAGQRWEQLNRAKADHAELERQRRQRAEARALLDEAEREHNRGKLIAELLGRDRLQRHLVRQAERQIVDYSNGVLDRLTGGQLRLRLIGSEDGAGADRALALEVFNRVAPEGPINVAFLSGSQRFRVAVSLALGIGQFASRGHRPIESVIIDEGFGCLDRNGRHVMIQELQNLRSQLQCILLVSHQEEFAEAFSNGYHFELSNGCTKVRRFER
jgi:DNA repair exonuclease SbcCD ATPase subunit